MDIYAGNINYQLSESDIRKLFEVFGEVEQITLIRDKTSGISKGFCFVLMPDATQAQRAIDELDGITVGGRNLVVKLAKARSEKESTADDRRLEEVLVSVSEKLANKALNRYSKSISDDNLVTLNFKNSSN